MLANISPHKRHGCWLSAVMVVGFAVPQALLAQDADATDPSVQEAIKKAQATEQAKAATPRKKRKKNKVTIAVMSADDFKNTSGLPQEWLEKLNDFFTTSLVRTRKFDVIEREQLGILAKENALVQNEGLDSKWVDIMKVKGVKFLLTTSVTGWNVDQQKKKSLGVTKDVVTVRLELSIKMLDVPTGKIASAERYTHTKSYTVTGTGETKHGDVKGYFDAAVKDVVGRVVSQTVGYAFPIKVLGVAGQQVFINRGTGTEVQIGQMYEVFRQGEALVDPDTGETLGSAETKVAQVKIVSITPKFSKADIVSSTGAPTKGDILRLAAIQLSQKSPVPNDESEGEGF